MSQNTKEKFKDLALNLTVSGASYALSIHFLFSGDLGKAALSAFCPFLLSLLVSLTKKLENSFNKLFDWVIEHLEGNVLQLWWLATSNFKRKYYQGLIEKYNDYQTQGLKTRGPFSLDLEKVFVPLKVAPESIGQISSDMLQKKVDSNDLQIWNILTQRVGQSEHRRIAILGPPGSGKTTLLAHITLTYAKNQQSKYESSARRLIPILIYLRDISEKVSKSTAPDLPTLLEKQAEIKKLNPNGWFSAQLERGRCLVMLDGLDEIADSQQRREVSHWVQKQMGSYPRSIFVVTSRPFGYRNMPLDGGMTTLEVRPFTLSQMRDFIKNWYSQIELKSHLDRYNDSVQQTAEKQAGELIQRISNQPSLSKLALNPLLLTMIATVHRYRGALPGRRVELYSEICDVLLGRRQEAKDIVDLLTPIQKKVVIQSLALELMLRNTRKFSLELGSSLIKEPLESVGNNISPVSFLENIEHQSGLIVEKEQNEYEFTHKSFQEYLAAVEIKDRHQVDFLVRKIDDEWWAETIRLYSAQSDATPFIKAATTSNDIKVLSLALDCLEEKMKVQPTIRERLDRKMLDGLSTPGTEMFNLAAETKIARRTSKLLRIDEKTAIDTTYITCAEYQLFIDEQRQRNKQLQPEHWSDYYFPRGMATHPITGVRADDAKEFVHWLSSRTGEYYRLPNQEEVESYKVASDNLGTWSLTSNNHVQLSLVTISEDEMQSWRSRISSALQEFIVQDFTTIWNRNSNTEFKFDKVLTPLLDRVNTYNVDFSHAYDLTRTPALVRHLDLNRSLKCALERNDSLIHLRKQEHMKSLEIERQRDLDLAHERKLSSNIRLSLSLEIDTVNSTRVSLEDQVRDSLNTNYKNSNFKDSKDPSKEPEPDPDLAEALERTQEKLRNLKFKLKKEQERIDKQGHERKRLRERSYKQEIELDNELRKALNHALNSDLNLAHSIATNVALDKSLENLLDTALLRTCNLENARVFVLMYVVVWEILSRFYERSSSSNQTWLALNREEEKADQLRKEECLQNFNRALDVYVFFSIIHMRRISKLPTWESIQIVKETT